MSVFRSASVKQKNGIAFYLVVAVMFLSVFIPILLDPALQPRQHGRPQHAPAST